MPPIIVKEYEWHETLQEVNIIVHIPGISVKNSDIFMTEAYVKISCAPFIWEIFLKHDVNPDNCVVKIEHGVAKIRLLKKESILWYEIAQQLSESIFKDKKSLIEKRQQEISKHQKTESERKENEKEKKRTWNRSAIDEQMKLDEEEKQRIKDAMARDKLETMKLMFSTTAHSRPTLNNDVTGGAIHRKAPPPPRTVGKIVLEFTQGKDNVPTRESWN